MLVAGGCTRTQYDRELPCAQPIGRCLDVEIDGKPVSPLAPHSIDRYLTGARESLAKSLTETRWMAAGPVCSTPSFRVVASPNGESWFGARPQADVQVLPLEDQTIHASMRATRREDDASDDLSFLLAYERPLPVGAYLFVVTVRGAQNWDRRVVYAEIRE